jgi:thiol-disulfide isomerase/thioredoxin
MPRDRALLEESMRKALLGFVLVFMSALPLYGSVQHGEVMEQVSLPVPSDQNDRTYLGLGKKAGQFTLRDIDADIVIVEIFSMYCPHCQKHAPTANRLHEIIEADKRTRGRVKLIGIGVGNSAYEVKFFKKKYTVPFPLFDDENSQILNKLTGIRTPTFFGVRKRGPKVEAFFIEQGPHDDADAFLKDVIRKSGISL